MCVDVLYIYTMSFCLGPLAEASLTRHYTYARHAHLEEGPLQSPLHLVPRAPQRLLVASGYMQCSGEDIPFQVVYNIYECVCTYM